MNEIYCGQHFTILFEIIEMSLRNMCDLIRVYQAKPPTEMRLLSKEK